MSIRNKIMTAVLGLSLVATMAPGIASAALTSAQVQAIISLLQSFGADATTIANVNASLTGGTPTTPTTPTTGGVTIPAGFVFTRTMYVGATGLDVTYLKVILTQQGCFTYSVSNTGFGPLTQAGVKCFQAKYGISTVGAVGPITNAKLNSLLAGGVVTPAPVASGISASLSADTPAAVGLVNNQAGAGLLNINFTGMGTVTSVTLNRSGISNSDTLSNVYLYDGNVRLTGGYSFNTTTNQLVMNNISIPVSGTHKITVKGDVATGAATNASSIAVTLTGFTANGVTVSSNIMGNMMSVVAGTLATANFTSTTASPANTSINAGSINQTLWSRTLNLSPRTVYLQAFTVKMIGSAPSNTLANVGLYIDGAIVATAAINANNQFVFAPTSLVSLATGSHLVEVRGDVVGGAYRNFYISLEQGSDIVVMDSQLGVGITATAAAATLVNLNSGTISVNNGTLTIAQDITFNNTTTVVGGATNVQMAGFVFTSYGEDVKVTTLSFTPTISGTGTTLTNVGLYIDGGQVGSNQTATTATTLTFSNLGSSLLIPVGKPVKIAIKGDAITSGGVSYTTGAVKFDLIAGSGNAQGMSSSQLTSTAAQGGQSLTISSANVTFGQTVGFAAPSAAPNSSAVKIGSFTLQTGSAEGVTLNSIALTIGAETPATSGLAYNNQLTNLTVKHGSSVIGTPVGNPVVGVNNFSANIPVQAQSTVMLDVYADIGSSGATLKVTPSMAVTYQGLVSRVSTTTSTIAGVTTTANVATIVQNGVVFVPGSVTSLASQYVTGNGTNPAIGIATFNVKTSNNVGGALLRDMTFTTVSSTISAITVNGRTASVNTSGVAIVPTVGITVPSDNSGINIPVTATLVCVGTSGCAGVSGANVAVTLSEFTFNDGSAIQTVTANPASATSNIMSLVASSPTVTLTSGTTTGLQVGSQQIGTFTIRAGDTGDIAIKQIPVVTGVNGTITIPGTTVELRDASGNALSGAPAAVASGSQNFVFSTARTITKGTSETFTVYATTGGSTGAAGTSNVTFSLGAKASFLWNDVIGNVNNLTGTNIYSYPTGSQTKSN